MNEITIIGDEQQTGAYLLRINVASDLELSFGRFQGGKPFNLPQGNYIYVGSAMAKKGSMTLARRLTRHASRHDKNRPQFILPWLLAALKGAGLGPPDLQPSVQKSLFWNVDFLLEEIDVTLTHVLVVRCGNYLEDFLAGHLIIQPGCFVPVKGLGAHDKRGQTHLLGFLRIDDVWRRLPQDFTAYLA